MKKQSQLFSFLVEGQISGPNFPSGSEIMPLTRQGTLNNILSYDIIIFIQSQTASGVTSQHHQNFKLTSQTKPLLGVM